MLPRLRNWLYPELRLLDSDIDRSSVWHEASWVTMSFWRFVAVALAFLGAQSLMLLLLWACGPWLPGYLSVDTYRFAALALGSGLGGAISARIMLVPMRRHLRQALCKRGILICVGCGYNLSGNRSGECPECGYATD